MASQRKSLITMQFNTDRELLELPVKSIDFSDETEEQSIKRRESKWIPSVEGI